MIKLKSIMLLLVIVIFTISCKERYYPELSSTQTNYLVVEGFINAQGYTTIKLSRSTPLDVLPVKPELRAQVRITGEDNHAFNVSERNNGTYISDSLILNKNQKYRLHIKTSVGGEYLSEFTAIKTSPVIDSISWQIEDNGVRIFLSSHDQQNNSRYYKWDFEEDWELHSAFENRYEYRNGVIVERSLTDIPKFLYCWSAFKSTNILLGSTVQLTNDVVNLAPITFIPIDSEKLSVRYSILIKQYALDRSAYDFFKMMKSNTETLGSIFDPLPSDLTGNITCISNPVEKVIGHVSANTVAEKRIFITSGEVNAKFLHSCQVTNVPNKPDSIRFYFNNGILPFDSDGKQPIETYSFASRFCIDCTTRGTNIKPSFW